MSYFKVGDTLLVEGGAFLKPFYYVGEMYENEKYVDLYNYKNRYITSNDIRLLISHYRHYNIELKLGRILLVEKNIKQLF